MFIVGQADSGSGIDMPVINSSKIDALALVQLTENELHDPYEPWAIKAYVGECTFRLGTYPDYETAEDALVDVMKYLSDPSHIGYSISPRRWISFGVSAYHM